MAKKIFFFDSADKMIHQIPVKYELDSEKAIPIVDEKNKEVMSISIASEVIKKMTEPINIKRIYVSEDKKEEAEAIVNEIQNMMKRSN